MYAATLPGGVCIVTYAEMGDGPDSPDISGPLPDGRCLAP
ncbi:hypothetical protein EDD30_0881 [Couchioplanes caeruleus]|uniref:Uncharacterized protein n=1 Tax=Couchioplanes caeruleus TaxID=56438 RepID=A0A3N1GDC5_9ACTN|nr:hypothetical protein EDD30_0881 [Couchioplanes caeruleus]